MRFVDLDIPSDCPPYISSEFIARTFPELMGLVGIEQFDNEPVVLCCGDNNIYFAVFMLYYMKNRHLSVIHTKVKMLRPRLLMLCDQILNQGSADRTLMRFAWMAKKFLEKEVRDEPPFVSVEDRRKREVAYYRDMVERGCEDYWAYG